MNFELIRIVYYRYLCKEFDRFIGLLLFLFHLTPLPPLIIGGSINENDKYKANKVDSTYDEH